MVASIGVISSARQGVSYYERDGYYARDDPAHREASAWLGKGAGALDLAGSVEPQTFEKVLEGYVPDGSGRRLGKRGKNGSIHHRPGRDVTLSAPKSVSLATLVGGDRRIVSAHDRAVKRTLAWVEKNVLETRVMDPDSKTMVRRRDQKMVAATFRHDTSRNLDPQLHTHAVIANMLQGGDGKWRTMANEKLYRSKMLIGALYRSELARELKELGYGLYKTHADGRFEIRGVSREVIEAFSTRRAEIQKAMHERGLGKPGDNPALAARAALMTRAHKRDVDHEALRAVWDRQAEHLGFDTRGLADEAMQRCTGKGRLSAGLGDGSPEPLVTEQGRPVSVTDRARKRSFPMSTPPRRASTTWLPLGAVRLLSSPPPFGITTTLADCRARIRLTAICRSRRSRARAGPLAT